MRWGYILGLIGIVAANGHAKAQIAISDWFLNMGVQDLSAGGEQHFVASEVVQNPYQANHSVSQGIASAITSYDFSWSGDNASFRIDATHVDPDLGGARYVTSSTGNIIFTTTANTRVNLNGLFEYNLPVSAIDLRVSVAIFDAHSFQNFLSDVHLVDTFTHPGPAVGTIVADNTGLLPAGRDYRLNYIIRIEAFGNSGAIATADGYLHLTLEPVPEPGTAALLAAASPLMRRMRSPR